MTLQALEDCARRVYRARKDDFSLSDEEKDEFLNKKYPIKDTTGNRALPKRITAAIAALRAEASAAADSCFSAEELRRLCDQIYLKEHMLSEDGECRNMVRVLCGHLSGADRFPADAASAEKLFDAAADLTLIDVPYSIPGADALLERQVKAAKLLQKYLSSEWMVQEGELCITKADFEALQRELERRIAGIGGFAVLWYLFAEEIKPYYHSKSNRYYLLRRRRGGKNWLELPETAVPCNYIIQLAYKHLDAPIAAASTANAHEKYRELVEISRAMMTVFDLSSPESIADFLTPHQKMPKFITDNALYETLCIPEQYTPSFCETLVTEFYLPVMHEAGLGQLKRALPAVLHWCMEQQPLARFTAEDVRRGTGLGEAQIRLVLELCSVKYNELNRDFLAPGDRTNGWDYPLIYTPDEDYFQFDPHFSGYAFCECLYRALSSKIDAFDRKMGERLEEFIKTQLRRKHIPFLSGHYKGASGEDRDCDLVLEGEDSVVFAEIKKRPLPIQYRRGDDVEIYHALADGMVKGFVQAVRHKRRLEKDGSLSLYWSAKYTDLAGTITKKDRRIYTITICLPEYAFLNNAVIAQKIFQNLQGTLSSYDPAKSGRLDRFNKLGEEFRSIMDGEDADSIKAYYHFSTFRSLHQLWTALSLCKDGDVDRLIDCLTFDCTMANSRMDYYDNLMGKLRLEQFEQDAGSAAP